MELLKQELEKHAPLSWRDVDGQFQSKSLSRKAAINALHEATRTFLNAGWHSPTAKKLGLTHSATHVSLTNRDGHSIMLIPMHTTSNRRIITALFIPKAAKAQRKYFLS